MITKCFLSSFLERVNYSTFQTAMFQSGAKITCSSTWRNFLSQKRSKLCHDPSNISFHKLFFICIWKITKLKLRLHRLSQIPEINLHDNIVLCKYLKSEIMRCVGSFTSWVSQSILLISLWAKSAILWQLQDENIWYTTNIWYHFISLSDQTIHIKFNSVQALQYLHLFDYTS